jgi:LacI family transcriptional regulator
MRSLSDYCCQNSECSNFGKRGGGNLNWNGWSGKGKQIRMIYCRTCKRSFSERKGTALFLARLPEDEALGILGHLSEGCGIRHTGRLTGHSKDTVNRYAKVSGKHAKAAHEELVSFSPEYERSSV